jgi:hypothetical protein
VAAPRALEPEFANYVVSYPKTGRTWLRMMLGRYVCATRRVSLDRVNRTLLLLAGAGMPTSFIHGDAGFEARKHYRELKADKTAYREKKVLLLGRDVRDTVVSAYFHTTRRLKLFEGTISEFARDEYYGAPKILTFYRLWHEGRAAPREFLFLRYEDMHRNPADALASVLRFLGEAAVDAQAVSVAVEFAAFENLRKAESEDRFHDRSMTAGAEGDPESYKFRRGKAGGYADYLSAEDIAYIDDLNAKIGCEFTR